MRNPSGTLDEIFFFALLGSFEELDEILSFYLEVFYAESATVTARLAERRSPRVSAFPG
jgi:hypothetical protein